MRTPDLHPGILLYAPGRCRCTATGSRAADVMGMVPHGPMSSRKPNLLRDGVASHDNDT